MIHIPLRQICAVLVVLFAFFPLACKKGKRPEATPVLQPDLTAPEPSAKEVTAAIETWFSSRTTMPPSPEALVQAGLLKRLPTPPPGQKFVMDGENFRFRAVPK